MLIRLASFPGCLARTQTQKLCRWGKPGVFSHVSNVKERKRPSLHVSIPEGSEQKVVGDVLHISSWMGRGQISPIPTLFHSFCFKTTANAGHHIQHSIAFSKCLELFYIMEYAKHIVLSIHDFCGLLRSLNILAYC